MSFIKTLTLAAIVACPISACNSRSSSVDEDQIKYDKANMTRVSNISVSDTLALKEASEKSAKIGIDAAIKAGKSVFLVAFDQVGINRDKALSVAKEAADKKPGTIDIVELDMAKEDNKVSVLKYHLTGSAPPLIIVIDRNGTPVGGLILAEATPDALLELIPSPKYAEILKALNERKAVFIVTYKETMEGKITAFENCCKAVSDMEGKAVIVKLNIHNLNETTLIQNLGVNRMSTEPVIYVINKLGQVTDAFPPETKASQLVWSTKKTTGGDCINGYATSCIAHN
jgi:hypothetical protein